MRQHYNFSKIKCDASFQPRDKLWVPIDTFKPCNGPKCITFVNAMLFFIYCDHKICVISTTWRWSCVCFVAKFRSIKVCVLFEIYLNKFLILALCGCWFKFQWLYAWGKGFLCLFSRGLVGPESEQATMEKKQPSLQEIYPHVPGNSACVITITLIASCPPP
jgi:hypothetical protein